jgi:hypothetical protein
LDAAFLGVSLEDFGAPPVFLSLSDFAAIVW